MNVLNGCFLLSVTSVVFGVGFYFLNKNQTHLALIFNVLGGLILRGWCATDKFLYEWDERFHVLVAKNLMQHPLRPTLYDNPVLPYNITHWADNHIWVCKQPLPLWAIAASLKVFGISEFAARIPSLIVGSAAIVLTFLIAKQLFQSPKIAYWAAFFHAIHGLTIDANTARDSSDHVLTFFAFFIQLGVFCAILSAKTNKKIWFSILAGACMGCAYMCKWHPALIVLPIWLVVQTNFKDILRGIAPLSIAAIAVALPWQIYIYRHFPAETTWIYGAIFQPMTEAIQGHDGAWWYYLEQVRISFGELIYLPMVWLAVIFVKKWTHQNIRTLAAWVFFPLLVYSMMGTKRQSYLVENAAAIFILSALFIRILSVYKNKTRFSPKIIQFVVILLVGLPIRYTIERVKPFATNEQETQTADRLRGWKTQLPTDGKAVVFNTPYYIETMFYHNITAAYPHLPTEAQIAELLLRGYKIFVVRNENVPTEFLNRTDIQLL